MKYLDALLAQKSPRPEPTEPTKDPLGARAGPGEATDRTDTSPDPSPGPPSVGLVSAPSGPVEPRGASTTAGSGEIIGPPLSDDSRPPCAPPYPWRAELSGWSIPWREAWGRRSNRMEEAEGLCWWRAEREAHATVSRLKAKGVIPPGATSDVILNHLDEEGTGQ